MLTEKQYRSLCRYRDSFVPASGKPDDETTYFFERGFIKIEKYEYSLKGECEVFYMKTLWVLTMPGKLALEEFEEFADKIRREKAEKETDKRADRLFQTKQTILNAVVGAVVGAVIALLVEHFHEIFEFIGTLFH